VGGRIWRLVHVPAALQRVTVITAAAILTLSSVGFLFWAVTTRSAGRLAWLTSVATVLAVVLASWAMSAGMLAWVVHSGRKTSHSEPDSVLSPGGGQVVVGEIPREPAGFQPRTNLQTELMASSKVTVLSVVTGGRGMGKTQLAAAVARRRIGERWPVVAWIVAEDWDQVVSGMERLARALGLVAAEEDSLTAALAARTWLETGAPARSMVVFDNVPEPEIVRRWLPTVGQSPIIITSTNRACEDLGTTVRVGAFTTEEAIDFLGIRTGLADEAGAEELARELGCLPLALAQVAAVIRSQQLSNVTALERIRTLPVERYLPPQSADSYPRGAAQAVLLSVQQVEETDSLAGALTGLIGVLSPAGIRRDLLHAFNRNEEQPGPDCANNAYVSDADIDTTLGRLAEASLLTFTVDGDAVLMHRFTQRVLRDRAAHDDVLAGLIVRAARLIRSVWPEFHSRTAIPDGQQWVTQRALGQHLIMQTDALWGLTTARAGNEPSHDETSDRARDLVLDLRSWAVYYLWSIDAPGRAIEIGNAVVADHECILGDECWATTVARSRLALACGMQRRHDEAIALNSRVVAWFSASEGAGHPTTLNARNSLACNYTDSFDDFVQPERLTTAIALHEENRAAWESINPDDRYKHHASFFTESNLARCYARIGRDEEAIRIAENNVCVSEQKLGEMHFLTVGALSACVEAYAAGGRLKDALSVSRRALQRAHAMWGDTSPLTLEYRQRQAQILCQAGELRTAISDLEEVASAQQALLGENSTRTCMALEALSEAYSKAGRPADALQTYEKVLKICINTAGPDSPLTRRIHDQIIGLRADNENARVPAIMRIMRIHRSHQ
jgi:tetratricopeptide (TPR) repeat protein